MSGDVVVALQFFTGSVACILTFLYVLTIGKFSKLKPKEWGLFALGLLATLVWWKFRSATGVKSCFSSHTAVSQSSRRNRGKRDSAKSRRSQHIVARHVLWTSGGLLLF